MMGGKHGWLGWMACLVLAVLLGMVAPVAAGTRVVTGEGLIVEKNIEKGLVTLHTGVVLEVTALTKIASAQGKRMTVAELAVASSDLRGILPLRGDAMVRYQGRAQAGRVSVYSIRVMGTVPH
jgi:hypothetical protein